MISAGELLTFVHLLISQGAEYISLEEVLQLYKDQGV